MYSSQVILIDLIATLITIIFQILIASFSRNTNEIHSRKAHYYHYQDQKVSSQDWMGGHWLEWQA